MVIDVRDTSEGGYSSRYAPSHGYLRRSVGWKAFAISITRNNSFFPIGSFPAMSPSNANPTKGRDIVIELQQTDAKKVDSYRGRCYSR
jgi:hypothetical protein